MRSVDPESARRQLHVSVVLVVAMLMATFVLGLAIRPPSSTKPAPIAHDSTGFTGRLVNINDR